MSAGNTDRRIVLWLAAAVCVIVLLTAIFAPATRDDDPTPSTYNSGTQGIKAAFLLLSDLGYSVTRSHASVTEALDRADAPHTTYVLADPYAPAEGAKKREYAAIEDFLRRGGRVVATGFGGAYFLPDGRTGQSTQFVGSLCNTTTEGMSPYAQAGSIATYNPFPWTALEPAVRVDQRCGNDAVVVHRPYPNGGEYVWWSSAEPMTNRGIAQDSSLRLLLAAVGPATGAGARHIIFDELYHGTQASASDYLKGLPLRSLLVQAALLVALLLFSFSRRSGPLRQPVRVPRTSPVEFAQNMGALYERAAATQPATEAARRRLLYFLTSVCGLPADIVHDPASAVAAAVQTRFGSGGPRLETLLERAAAARYERLRPREALALVRDIDDEIASLRTLFQSKQAAPFKEQTEIAVTLETK